ncbi:uncharacterized protein H6S33_004841 [Morchella sextelata]|uniref:uncharacterized protein n=1 Tax=Morchella sextelata TaxID=1174677 RepID=UPI001D0510EA|nr:uncharacterized protein H6S33_004841 [Morchella sextelata]KAH0605619.1 hypothetical protein H6S33_004841 [Morchella sextelata]
MVKTRILGNWCWQALGVLSPRSHLRPKLGAISITCYLEHFKLDWAIRKYVHQHRASATHAARPRLATPRPYSRPRKRRISVTAHHSGSLTPACAAERTKKEINGTTRIYSSNKQMET